MHAGHAALDALCKGAIIDLEGMLLRMDGDGTVEPGDIYVGARNTVDVYICDRVDSINGWVFPEGVGYPFNIGECVKVLVLEDAGATADYVVPDDCFR